MFRTELTIAPQERLLSRTARVLTMGSCFADSIGERLRLNKVNALVNPFGTVFQPLALAQLLRAAAGEEQDWQQHVVEARGRWQSYDLHSTVGAESPVELLQTIQETVRRVGDFVRTADAVMLTLGTAWAYRLRETGELVNNLHKLPASLFEKELLTADEIVNGLAEVHALLRRVNPDIKIVLTVSPVRHIKDTLPLNAVSKSVLRVACHYLSELLPNVSYFPAYELLTDDLRDYRFYAADMLHPSEVAEDYIWERFARAYFDADFGRFRKEWAAVRQSLGHRPLHSGAPEHRTFLDQTRERLERMVSQGVDVRQELRDVQRQLAALPPPKPVRVPEPELEDDGEERIDIGEGTVNAPVAAYVRPREVEVPEGERRNDRRDNRRDGRRDGRRNDRDRSDRDRRTGHPAPAMPVEAVPAEVAEAVEETLEATATEVRPMESVVTSVEAVLTNPENELLTTEEAGYPAKKKKRRSRGGAKRTARKHAARLAEQELPTTKTGGRAEAELLEEQAQQTAGVEVAAALAEVPVVASTPAAVEGELAELEAEAADQTLATPTVEPATRKRGTGPTPKKSKVITKSPLVKRGQRGGLYRSTPAEAGAAAETPAAVPAMAPIISPPIIPEILLERPAADYAVVTAAPAPAMEPDLAATVLGLYASKPKAPVAGPTPKRGRPKSAATATAAAPTPPTSVAAEAPVAAAAGLPVVTSEPVTMPEPTAATAALATTATEPAATAAEPVPTTNTPATKPAAPKKTTATAKAATPKKPTAKPASSKAATPKAVAKPAAAKKPASKAAAKPAAAKKAAPTAAAKPATTRRGRPPGAATAAEADETPATS